MEVRQQVPVLTDSKETREKRKEKKDPPQPTVPAAHKETYP